MMGFMFPRPPFKLDFLIPANVYQVLGAIPKTEGGYYRPGEVASYVNERMCPTYINVNPSYLTQLCTDTEVFMCMKKEHNASLSQRQRQNHLSPGYWLEERAHMQIKCLRGIRWIS